MDYEFLVFLIAVLRRGELCTSTSYNIVEVLSTLGYRWWLVWNRSREYCQRGTERGLLGSWHGVACPARLIDFPR